MSALISELEEAIVARLQTAMPEMRVESMPNDAAAYDHAFRVGAILVQYSGSEFSQPETFEGVIQIRTLRFGVLLMVRDLRGPHGAYDYLDAIRTSLTGFFPLQDWGPLFPMSEEFSDRQSHVWVFSQVFGLTAVHQNQA